MIYPFWSLTFPVERTSGDTKPKTQVQITFTTDFAIYLRLIMVSLSFGLNIPRKVIL